MFNKTKLAICAAVCLGMAGCASTDYYDRPYRASGYDYGYTPAVDYHGHYGVIRDIRWVEKNNRGGIGVGAVVGSIIGGLVGNQIGSGSGRTAATVGGAIAGGVIGDKISDSRDRGELIQVLNIRLNGGEILTITQDGRARFYEGQRVRILGTGSNIRVVTEGSYEYR